MNKIQIFGTVAYQPDLFYGANGTPRLSVTVEIEEPKVSVSGDISDKLWKYKVVLFGEQAEKLIDQIQAGSEIEVEGQIYTYSWKPSGQEQWFQRTEILANKIEVKKDVKTKLPLFAKDIVIDDDLPF